MKVRRAEPLSLSKTLNICIPIMRSLDTHVNSTLRLIPGPACIMPHFYGLLFILVLLKQCLATSVTLRQPSQPTSSVDFTRPSNLTSQPLSLSMDEWDCDPWDVTPNLDFRNCLHATATMPAMREIGQFHRGGATENIYRLPFMKASETCEIWVDFVDDVRVEAGRWSEVYLKTLEIVFGCVYGRGVGGYGLVGQHDRIQVSVRYLPEVARRNRTDAECPTCPGI